MTSSGANASPKSVKPANGSMTTARAGWRNAGKSATPGRVMGGGVRRPRSVERLAKDAFPWALIARECRLFDRIVKPAPSVSTPLNFPLQRRALLWATHLVFSKIAFEALQKLHPSAAEIIGPDAWCLIVDLCPVTTDRRKLAKVADFLEASIAVARPEWPHRETFRQAVTERATNITRDWLAVRIEVARAGRDGVRLTELGDGWFRIEDEAVLPLLWEKCGRPFGS